MTVTEIRACTTMADVA
jgi:taurine transport system ATP-binding protein